MYSFQVNNYDTRGEKYTMLKQFMLAILGLLVILLVACSNDTSSNEVDDAPNNTEELTESSSEEVAGEWPRSIEDAYGNEVIIDKKPEKVAVLHFGYVEYLLALGVVPVAAPSLDYVAEFETLQPFHTDLSSVEDIGDVETPNIEKLVELEPDLIIGDSHFHDSLVESLEKIAPVILRKNDLDWKGQLEYYGSILGADERASEFITESEEIIAETNEKLEKFNDKKFVFLRPSSKATFGIIGSSYYAHYHENGFGLNTPADYPEQWTEISLEGLAEMNPDYIFFQDVKESSQEAIAEVENDNVWNSISAVIEGDVYFIDISLNTASPLAIQLAAKQIVEALETEN